MTTVSRSSAGMNVEIHDAPYSAEGIRRKSPAYPLQCAYGEQTLKQGLNVSRGKQIIPFKGIGFSRTSVMDTTV